MFCKTYHSKSSRVNVLALVCRVLVSGLKRIANTSLVGRTGSGKVIHFCSLDLYLY
jgi:hypothetical protein